MGAEPSDAAAASITRAAEIASLGFVLIPVMFDPARCRRIAANLPEPDVGTDRREAGVRLDLSVLTGCCDILGSAPVREVIGAILGPGACAVRALLFDKVPAANWKVPWHRDRTISVRQRIETPGFGPWSMKNGIHHVQPPRPVLAGMLAMRVHLDDCDADSGPLRVIPGSHCDVNLDEPAATRRPFVTCVAPCGSALLMRPLLLHASSPARSPRRRRILHLEFAATALANGLEWRERIAIA